MILGWSEVTQSGKNSQKKKIKKKNLKDWIKWSRKMSGRSFYITIGAFGGTLLGTDYKA